MHYNVIRTKVKNGINREWNIRIAFCSCPIMLLTDLPLIFIFLYSTEQNSL